MANGTKATEKKAEKKPAEYTVQILTSKISAELEKKLANKETEVHDHVILQVLRHKESPIALDKLVGLVKETKRYHTKDDLQKSILWHCRKMNAEGLVKLTEKEG